MATLAEAAVVVLTTAEASDKAARSLAAAVGWKTNRIKLIGLAEPPERPARPPRPAILPPKQMKRRGFGGRDGKVALLHALAHIEFNAIDLAWDIVARYTGQNLPIGFYDDWVTVAEEETGHFLALVQLLKDWGADYGDLPAHDGLWDAARKTAHDLQARLVVVPLVLEARALDTAPSAIARLEENGDSSATAVLSRILNDEIGHVAIGVRWFEFLCAQNGEEPVDGFRRLLHAYFPKGLKPPFNHAARMQAGFPAAWYQAEL